MLKKIVDFFKRLNKKEWFRVGIRIFGFLLAADFVYGLIRYIFALFRSGLPFRYLFRFGNAHGAETFVEFLPEV